MSTIRFCFSSSFANHVLFRKASVRSKCWRTLCTTATDIELTITKNKSQIEPKPLIFNRVLKYMDNINVELTEPRQAWVENFDGLENEKRGLISLHPRIFSCFPRPDVIQENIKWQTTYRQIEWRNIATPQELPGHNNKPWPQKGTGRSRQHSKCGPHWQHGGWSHGPRGPTPSFYMLNFFKRVNGLVSTLAAKQAQSDLHIVDTLQDFSSDEPEYLESMMEKRKWGPSVLIVDTSEIFPRNLSLASNSIKHINLMPVFGLNVYSMLKHETLILTVAALESIEGRLLYHLRRTDVRNVLFRYKPPDVAASTTPLYMNHGH